MDYTLLQMAAIYKLAEAAKHARKLYNEVAVFKDDHSRRKGIIHYWFKMVEADARVEEYKASITL